MNKTENTAPKRKPGARTEDFSHESTEKLLKTAKPLVRSDFAGKPDSAMHVKNKLSSLGMECTIQEATIVRDLIIRSIRGCRDRVFPRINEAIKRCKEAGF